MTKCPIESGLDICSRVNYSAMWCCVQCIESVTYGSLKVTLRKLFRMIFHTKFRMKYSPKSYFRDYFVQNGRLCGSLCTKFRMKFRMKLSPNWYFGGYFVRNSLWNKTSESISYKISYVISYEILSEVSLSSFRSNQHRGNGSGCKWTWINITYLN